MGRRKGSKNKPKDVAESDKLKEKQSKQSEKKAEAAFDDLVKRAKERGALIEVTEYRERKV